MPDVGSDIDDPGEALAAPDAAEPADVADDDVAKTPYARSQARLGVALVILLGLTAALTAWSALVTAGYSSSQADAYARANLLAVQGSQGLTAASRALQQDKEVANQYADVATRYAAAQQAGDQGAAAAYYWQMENLLWGRPDSLWVEGVGWAADEQAQTGVWVSPFRMPGLVDKYFADANALIANSQSARAEGDRDKSAGNAVGLVQVGFAAVLLLLGAAEPISHLPLRRVMTVVGATGLVAATAYLLVLQFVVFPQAGA